jgi:hypothetical protein
MAAVADLAARIMDGIESLGVPWWGWAALVVMIFFGLLGPRSPQSPPAPGEPAGRT